MPLLKKALEGPAQYDITHSELSPVFRELALSEERAHGSRQSEEKGAITDKEIKYEFVETKRDGYLLYELVQLGACLESAKYW